MFFIRTDRFAVTSSDKSHREHIWTYKREEGTNEWTLDDHLTPLHRGLVAIHGQLLVVVPHDVIPGNVLGTVYKRVGDRWVQCETLKGEPVTEDLKNQQVQFGGDFVHSSRVSRHGYGLVYIHDLSQVIKS